MWGFDRGVTLKTINRPSQVEIVTSKVSVNRILRD